MGLQVCGVGYRFAFNGQVKDNEVAGIGNIMTAEFWEYDSRLGRRWNLDPIVKDWESGYATFSNNPVYFMDPLGLQSEVDKPLKEIVITPTKPKKYSDEKHGLLDILGRATIGFGKGLWGTVKYAANFFALNENNSFITTAKGLWTLGKTSVAGVNYLADKLNVWKEPAWSKAQREGIVKAITTVDWSDPEIYGEILGSAVGGAGLFKLTGKIGKFASKIKVAKAAEKGVFWVYGAFKSETKWANQLAKRGWTPEQVKEAIMKGEQFEAVNMVNKANSATRYVHPTTGKSVVIDNVTKELLQVGGEGFLW